MKSGTSKLILDGALALSLLLSIWFSYKFVMHSRELRSLNLQVGLANAHRSTIQALVMDSLEYSKKNPAIDPLLKTIGAKQ